MTEAPLRDSDIRWPLHQWLVDRHADCIDLGILHEMKMPRPSARIDIAVINGELCGFEIKSDVDSLARLPTQMRAFNAVFEKVCIVVTDRHVASARALIPQWWSVVVPNGSEGTRFEVAQIGDTNPEPDAWAMLYALYRAEISSILEQCDIRQRIADKTKANLIAMAVDLLSIDQVKRGVRTALKSRALATATSQYQPRRSQQRNCKMTQKIQKVLVCSADGAERELVLVRIEGNTAYVCLESRYAEAVQNPASNLEVGVPVEDVRFDRVA